MFQLQRHPLAAMVVSVVIYFANGLCVTTACAQSAAPTIHDSPEARLAYMQTSGDSYVVTVGASGKAKFRREPVLRFTNPVSGVVDGGLFVWQDESECPVAIAQIFIVPKTENLWLHEFQSLATEPLKFEYQGKTVWAPKSGGVKFESISQVNDPSPKAPTRLTQMRQIAARITVKDDFEGAKADELRLLPQPLVRYSNERVLDGGLFTYVHGTDPELLLLIEARKSSQGTSQNAEWKIAAAPMTAYAMTAKLDGQDFWSVPWRQNTTVSDIFKNFVYPPK